ncbi:unnamed protein product [Polarella glacialis]|uniref:Tyrosine specific protein phosphatases domain-containing protein n=1 Tax=Polarella glacialis TaxID=89957 RepID=A0A813KR03_POLGL|nr:unnamed protein product [Polarella glacialis]CAE8639870.1 unnamed protein product [Polarella glacialis]CAE8713060.1 unnamed protein product [Polarella glacialis]
MTGECSAGIFEILPSKLSWAPGKLEQSSLLEQGQLPAKQRVLSALELCSVSKPTESPESQGLVGAGGSYQVLHYSQEACGRAFGPLNFAQTIRFCNRLDTELSRLKSNDPLELLVLATPSQNPEARANSAVLLGAYLIFRLGWSVDQVTMALPEEGDLSFACSWSRLDLKENKRHMRALHCWQGLKIAQQNGWVSSLCCEDAFHADLVVSGWERLALTYDASWLVPGMVIICADPTTTVCDPNPNTFSELWPTVEKPMCGQQPEPTILFESMFEDVSPSKDNVNAKQIGSVSRMTFGSVPEDSGPASLASKDTVNGQQTGSVSGITRARRWQSRPTPVLISPNEMESPADPLSPVSPLSLCSPSSCPVSPRRTPGARGRRPSVCSSTDTVCKEYGNFVDMELANNHGGQGLPFFGLLQELGVKSVVRANFNMEAGMVTPSYDAAALQGLGMNHLSVPIADHNGGLPKPSDVAAVLEMCETLAYGYPIAVHCKGGFGRSVVLACAIAIDRFDVSGAAILGWVRIVRLGAVTTTEQEQMLCSFKGRDDLRKWAGCPRNTKCCRCMIQ